ncbi:type II toxin-antitoxin system RelE/ParE family toxin [Levilactobacillus enshiensis]|uniref:hypothetical protein n=1 Tax=Levilactobacillus enshiensis TaxID=2590213 RepID=UPI001CDD4C23|nr:hypothetical protein [Levilactobacillus enshiensis]
MKKSFRFSKINLQKNNEAVHAIGLKYKTHAVEKLCTNLKASRKKLGVRTAEALFGLMNLLESSDNLADVNALRNRHIHKLDGNRQGQYALDIAGRASSYRLLVQLLDENGKVATNDDNVDVTSFYGKIQIIQIEEVSKHYA